MCGSAVMILAQVACRNVDYRLKLQQLKKKYPEKYFIMDNGACENEPMSLYAVIHMARQIGVDEIVLPDRIKDPIATGRLVTAALRETIPFNQMVVPHSTEPNEPARWIDSYLFLSTAIRDAGLAKKTVYGIPRYLGYTNRLLICDQLEKIETKDTFHLLGLNKYTQEIKSYTRYPFIRSADTCVPVLQGIRGIAIEPKLTDRSKQAMNYDISADNFPDITRQNVKLFVEWAENAG